MEQPPTDAEVLDQAAQWLDELLSRASPGRWQVDDPWHHNTGITTKFVTSAHDGGSVVLGVPPLGTETADTDADLAYVAAMSPPVGRALVAAFTAAALYLQAAETNPTLVAAVASGNGHPPWQAQTRLVHDIIPHLVQVARTVLAGRAA